MELRDTIREWEISARRGYLEGLAERSLVEFAVALVAEPITHWRDTVLVGDCLSILAKRRRWSEIRALIPPMLQAIDRPGEHFRPQLAAFLVRLADRSDSLAPTIAGGLIRSAFRTVRQQGFVVASQHGLTQFLPELRRDLQPLTVWAAVAATKLMPTVELQTLAGELCTTGRRQVSAQLILRGVVIPVDWIDRDCWSHPVHWLVCRCLSGNVPESHVLQPIALNIVSEHEIRALARALVLAGRPA
ncbi:MAG TPA: hypothetical protein PKA27_12905 [Fimbriimonadaceae bacterium]|nr:hypothetical protein [Fimbriimonadaceae bacterium]